MERSNEPLPDFRLQDAEWEAWQEWHREVTRLSGIDVNHEKCNRLVSLTKIWGERLAELRRSQGGKGTEYSQKVIDEETRGVGGTWHGVGKRES